MAFVTPNSNLSFRVLASDYDATLATEGTVRPATLQAVRRLRAQGCKFVIISGRQREDLISVFPEMTTDVDLAILENGALLWDPILDREELLTSPPDPELFQMLERQGVTPLARGRSIIATSWEWQRIAQHAVEATEAKAQLIRNKDSLMILPQGVNKEFGLRHAARELRIPLSEFVGVGDAENDLEFLSACGWSVAVANCIPSLRDTVNWVTRADAGEGVTELIERLLREGLCPPRAHPIQFKEP